MPVDKWDDMEIELTTDPKDPAKRAPTSPSWDVREINAMVRPGKGPQDPKSRMARRRQVVQPK